MQETDKDFIGSVPRYYDQLLGPVLFADYAADLAKRVKAVKPNSILELAAGTAISSRSIKDALPSANLMITDLNEPMLEIAAEKFDSTESVQFRAVDAMVTPFEPDSFDLIACQFGVMFFPDKVRSFEEAIRLVRPGGRYIFNAWGPIWTNPFAMVANQCATKYFPNNPPGFYRAPFSYPNPEKVRADLKSAGWIGIESETVEFQQSNVDFHAFAKGLTYGNPIMAEIEARGGVEPDTFVSDLANEMAFTFSDFDGVVPLNATVYSARRPKLLKHIFSGR